MWTAIDGGLAAHVRLGGLTLYSLELRSSDEPPELWRCCCYDDSNINTVVHGCCYCIIITL